MRFKILLVSSEVGREIRRILVKKSDNVHTERTILLKWIKNLARSENDFVGLSK